MIPSVGQAREFLADTSPDKRNKLVDRLLAAPQFARFMAYVFDVWLMERRPDKGISHDDWQEYLFQSFAQHKPFDQLARELIAADGSNGDQRVRAKFLLDRDCDPNGLVRDVGRMFLGRDLQCAQCHDHPLVDDYHQGEYYGLSALLQRTYLYTDKQNGNVLYVGERAAGLPEFHSVFEPDDPQRLAIACVAGKVPIDLPFADVTSEYVVPPAENVRSVPRFSLRAELATHMTVDNPAFDRSIANRLWSHLFGKGLVDPVDMHHGDNPPTHPELLDMLASAIRELHYDVGQMLAALAKTKAYQRSIDPPPIEQIVAARQGIEQTFHDSPNDIAQREAGLEACEAEVQAAHKTRRETETLVNTLLRSVIELRGNLTKMIDEVAKQRAELESVTKQLSVERTKAQLVGDAAEKTKAALEKVPDDAQVKSAADALSSKTAALSESVNGLSAKHNELIGQLEQTERTLEQRRTDLSTAQQQLAEANQPLKAAHRQWLESMEHRDFQKAHLALARRRQQLAKGLVQLADLTEITPTEPDEIDRAYDGVVQDWARFIAVATPRPLSPEQLAWSCWQATGQLQFEQQAALDEWIQKHPAPSNLDPTSQGERQAKLEREVRRALSNRLAGTVDQFARLFGGAAGQVQTDFHATADQALFLANGGTILNILSPREENLSARLNKTSDVKSLADELYLSVLSRRPSAGEEEAVKLYLAERGDQREPAVRELAWSLLTSAEFRFYR